MRQGTVVQLLDGSDDPFDARYWPRTFRGAPQDDDLGGVWRLLGMAVGLTVGVGAVLEAVGDKRLTGAQQALAASVGLTYVAAGGVSVARPHWMPRAVRRRPRRTLLAGALPLAMVPMTGRRISPLHTLSASGGGVCGVVYGRARGQEAATLMATVWSTLAHGDSRENVGDKRPATWTHGVMPMAYVANAALGSTLASLAYTVRTLDVMLHRIADGQNANLAQAERLDAQLKYARREVFDALSDPEIMKHPKFGEIRQSALRAISRLHEDIAALRGLRYPTPEERRLTAFVFRYLVREPVSLPVPTAPVATVIDDALGDYAGLLDDRVSWDKYGVPSTLKLDGPAQLSLLGMVVSAATGNALRHSTGFRALHIDVTPVPGDQVRVDIVHDVPESCELPEGPVRPADGLKALIEAADRLGGTLATPERHGDRFVVSLTMPVRPPRSAPFGPTGNLVDWSAIYDKRRRAFDHHATANGLMVAVSLMSRARAAPQRALLSAGASLTVVAATFSHLFSGGSDREGAVAPGMPGDKRIWALMGAASIASALNVGTHRGVLSGWQGATIARLALDQHWPATLALTVAGSLGVAMSYRGVEDTSQLMGQVGTLACLPLGLRLTLMPFQRVMEGRDRQVTAGLEGEEVVVREARRLMGRHSPGEAVTDLSSTIFYADETFDQAAERLQGAGARIVMHHQSEASLYRRALNDVLEDVATVLSARAFPGEVTVDAPEVDALLLTGNDKTRLFETGTRRAVIAAADLIAREAFSQQPTTWQAHRSIDAFKVKFGSSCSETGNRRFLHVTISPVPWPTTAQEDDHPVVKTFCERLHDVGVQGVSWTDDGTVAFKLPA